MCTFKFFAVCFVFFASACVFAEEFTLKDNETGETYGPFADNPGTMVAIGERRMILVRRTDGDLTKARVGALGGAELGINDVSLLDEWAAELISESGVLKDCKSWIYIHPSRKYEARLTYVFDQPITSFEARIAIGRPEGDGNAIFAVIADGKEVYRSEAMEGGMAPIKVQVSFPSARKLTLVGERNGFWGHDLCIWLEPKVK
jgi:hypothetical protein